MLVLVLNCGSSSVKFQVIDTEGDPSLARGLIEKIGGQSIVTLHGEGRPAYEAAEAVSDHEAAVRRVIEWIRAAPSPPGGAGGFDAVGHRVVHGGARFVEPTVIDDDVVRAIEELEDLAPLHNAPSLAGIRACQAVLGSEMPMVAVFDTAFHAALPEYAHRYAISYELALRHGIRRFGFHGTSYRYVIARYRGLTGTPSGRGAIIALHLGNGCSVAAVRDGAPIDTSMGFTPLEGLVMGTRSGDLDPGVVLHLLGEGGLAVDDIVKMLHGRSGLAGLAGGGGDLRALLAEGGQEAALAIDI